MTVTPQDNYSARYDVRDEAGALLGVITRTPGTFGRKVWFTEDGRGWDRQEDACAHVATKGLTPTCE